MGVGTFVTINENLPNLRQHMLKRIGKYHGGRSGRPLGKKWSLMQKEWRAGSAAGPKTYIGSQLLSVEFALTQIKIVNTKICRIMLL